MVRTESVKVKNGEKASVMMMCNKQNNIKTDVGRDLDKFTTFHPHS